MAANEVETQIKMMIKKKKYPFATERNRQNITIENNQKLKIAVVKVYFALTEFTICAQIKNPLLYYIRY